MAYRLADRYAGKLLHVTGLGWHQWDGTRFAFDDRRAKRAVLAELRQALADSLDDKELRADVRKCESASGVAGVLDLAAALRPFASAAGDLDSDAHLLNAPMGLSTYAHSNCGPTAPRPNHKSLSRRLHPGAESPLWTAFLARVLPDAEVRGFLQRLAGIGLLGAVVEHVLGILTGVGANGKSVLDKRFDMRSVTTHALQNRTFSCTATAATHREMDLRGVRWVVVSETDKDRRLAEATMKRLTGGDTIAPAGCVRLRRVHAIHTPLLITNHLPKFPATTPDLAPAASRALRRRHS